VKETGYDKAERDKRVMGGGTPVEKENRVKERKRRQRGMVLKLRHAQKLEKQGGTF